MYKMNSLLIHEQHPSGLQPSALPIQSDRRKLNMLTIRKARQEDLPSLLAIYNYEIENGTATFDLNPKTLEERQKWFDLHSGGKYLLLTAEEDGKAVGYASLSPYREWEAYAQTVELSIYVDAAHRRKGIGDQLMQAILDYARQRDDIYTVVSVITGDNEKSIRMHEKYGFEDCGRLREVGMKFGRRLDVVNLQLFV